MKTINQEFFTNNILSLLKETFEGSSPAGSAYLDRGVGVLNTIDKVLAEKASQSIGENGATIAAHLDHARFYLVILLEFMNGRTEKVDWDESWTVRTVNETQWNSLKENTKKAYQKVTKTFQTIEDWDDDKVGGAMAIVVHTAYHLGAIRQIAKSI
ncbi:MAG: DinB family protein [Acidobacteria bacterium]|nr:DinB family protein [Acidobacteriota bacterium]